MYSVTYSISQKEVVKHFIVLVEKLHVAVAAGYEYVNH